MTNKFETLMQLANDNDISLVNASLEQHASLVAIHLLNPNLNDLGDAIDTAIKDGFFYIVCHNAKTWPKRQHNFDAIA